MNAPHDRPEPPLAAMEAILDRLERVSDPAVREDARALVRLLLRLHSDALARLVEIARQAPAASALLASWKNDPQVATLLLLHGLHPDDLSSRVRHALQSVQVVSAFLGVEAQPLEIHETCLRIELVARPDVPAHALVKLKEQIEAAICQEAPEVQVIHFEESGCRRTSLPVVATT